MVLLVGCGGENGESWSGPPRPAADGRVEVDGFNEHLDADDDARDDSPPAVAVEFLRPERQQAARTSIRVWQPSEGGDVATVVATFAGLLDDSVEAARYTLALERTDVGWRLRAARREQRCARGRGHRAFSPEVCL